MFTLFLIYTIRTIINDMGLRNLRRILMLFLFFRISIISLYIYFWATHLINEKCTSNLPFFYNTLKWVKRLQSIKYFYNFFRTWVYRLQLICKLILLKCHKLMRSEPIITRQIYFMYFMLQMSKLYIIYVKLSSIPNLCTVGCNDVEVM